MDLFIFNGPITFRSSLDFIKELERSKKSKHLALILVTLGGDADAAFRMSKYVHKLGYEKFTLYVSGICKSSGTLIALGAHELVFGKFGELGPLDVQISKEDKLGYESGLVIKETLTTLEGRAIKAYIDTCEAVIEAFNNQISFPMVSKAANEMIHTLYGALFAKVDPKDVGEKERSMRVAKDYGRRLALYGKNIKSASSIDSLVEDYPAHNFVIDSVEAQAMFNNARKCNEVEQKIIDELEEMALIPIFSEREKVCGSLQEVTKGARQNETRRPDGANTGGIPADVNGTVSDPQIQSSAEGNEGRLGNGATISPSSGPDPAVSGHVN